MKRSAFKTRGKPLQAKTPLAKQSPKRKAYRASAARLEAVEHMLRVKALPCVVCGAAPPTEAHHCTGGGMARDDWAVLSLCKPCHLRYHARKRTWIAENGQDFELLPRVYAILGYEKAPADKGEGKFVGGKQNMPRTNTGHDKG